jgi:hypothetical protein
VKTATKSKTMNLASSYSEWEARRIAQDLSERLGVESIVTRLTTHTGIETDWYLVHVPTRLLSRAEDFVAGWKAGQRNGAR